MSHAIQANYNEILLFPPCVEDWVPADHPVRFIRDFVAAADLPGLGFPAPHGTTGRPHYAVALLVGVWLYGYLHQIRSSRQLEVACHDHLPLLWLTGNHPPDHNTLWRFWQRHRVRVKALYAQTVRVALQCGCVGLALQAVDGTKLRAAGSPAQALDVAGLTRLLATLDAQVQALEADLEANAPTTPREEAYRLPTTLQEAQARRAEIAAALAQVTADERSRCLRTEPEARPMRMAGQPQWGYNAQAVVDAATQVIVGAAVSPEANDSGQLVPMVAAAAAQTGTVATETVADGGYASAAQLALAEDCGYAVTVAAGTAVTGPYHTGRFQYDAARDVFICPCGQVLHFVGASRARSGRRRVRKYQCGAYRQCAQRWACSRARTGRALCVSEHYGALQRQRAKQATPAAQAVLRRRKQIVEPVFAWIKQGLGFRRWSWRGLAKVEAEWLWLCACINLKRLYQLWKTQRLVFAGG